MSQRISAFFLLCTALLSTHIVMSHAPALRVAVSGWRQQHPSGDLEDIRVMAEEDAMTSRELHHWLKWRKPLFLHG